MGELSTNPLPIEATMSAILVTAFAILIGMHFIQIRHKQAKTSSSCNNKPIFGCIQLPSPKSEPTKYCYEIFSWYYTIIWISIFGMIIITQCYEYFTAATYLIVCGGLALPLLVQPILYPQAIQTSISTFLLNDTTNKQAKLLITNPDINRPFHKRYATKVTIYLLTYSFIGNYWYTHYFYSVLNAQYTMPSYRLNNVPMAMFCATHFYFTTYHVCISNGLLRHVDRSYVQGWRKRMLFVSTVLFLSYFTAFMETLTISSFPYYSFEDRTMAYVWGSAFYGIYFIVSFPGFYYLDANIDADIEKKANNKGKRVTLMDTFTIACGHGMMILILLDFVRLYLGIPLVIGGVAFVFTSGQ